LEPQFNKRFAIRLQEFAGRATQVKINFPVRIKSASKLNLTEDVELEKITTLSPLTVQVGPFATTTIRVEIEPDK
jgi:Glycosyl hydrolases family 38 C-terminal beta sandwich domain